MKISFRAIGFLSLLTVVTSFSGCGSKSNLNQVWGKDDQSVESMLVEAQVAYDRKEFDKAEELSLKILDINPNIGDAAVVLGYTYLAKSGLHPFTIAKKMAKQNKSDPNDTDVAKCGKPADSSATETLKNLSCRLLTMTTTDYNNLGTVKSMSSTGTFANTKIFVPNEVSDTMRAKINVLDYTNKGVKTLCGFVNRAALSAKDDRHTSSTCAERTTGNVSKSKAHFLFALLHLTESLVYQTSILSDSVGDTGSTNPLKMSDTLKATTFDATNPSKITEFAVAVTDLKSAVDQVYAVDKPLSQLNFLLYDLKTISASFAQIPGIPKNVTKKLDEGIATIEANAKKLGGSDKESAALKAQMNEKMAKDMASKINDLAAQAQAAGQTFSADQKSQVCSAYSSISTGVSTDTVTPPTICQ